MERVGVIPAKRLNELTNGIGLRRQPDVDTSSHRLIQRLTIPTLPRSSRQWAKDCLDLLKPLPSVYRLSTALIAGRGDDRPREKRFGC